MGEMMDSFLEQLAQNDRTVSVDAYQTLSNVIRQYDDIPEEEVLKTKINTFIKYIKRDLLRKPSPNEPPIADTNLMTQALRVLVIFVWNKDYASHLSDESRTFILDRSIQVLTEHTAPKSVIVHYLHLLASQNFRPALITSYRVSKLLEALKVLPEHYKGNGVISERLLLYHKLLDQERPTMKVRASLWVEGLLSGMTNGLKDIRTKAIELGMKACSAFPPSSSISGVIKSVLSKEIAPGKAFSSSICRKLEKMISVTDEGVQVPQIWTIVLRLSNNIDERERSGSSTRIDKWPQFRDWLSVIQKCFNCSESAIQRQAYQAWNRFIHIVQPHLTSDNLLQLLAKPMTAHIERHGGEQTNKGARMAAVSSYCTLLYYAFRPAATHDQYTRVWNEYIVKVMRTSFFEKSTANADLASRIFMSLFWNSKKGTKIWNDSRALENTLLEPEDLPIIDCKWIRSKTKAILEMFHVLMRYSSWGASGQSENAHIAVAWMHFLKAIREANKKEIKPSSETVEAVTGVTKFLGHCYENIPENQKYSSEPAPISPLTVAQVRQLTVIAVGELGPDLIQVGLKDKGRELSKALVLYDALQPLVTAEGEESDPNSTSFDRCLTFLDEELVRDFQSEESNDTESEILQIQHRLEVCSDAHIAHTLSLLSRPTILLLMRDLTTWDRKVDNKGSSSLYPQIISTTIHLLSTLPCSAIWELDEILGCLLSNKRDAIVEQTVKVWNTTFGPRLPFPMGPRLVKALTTLESLGVGICLPGRSTDQPSPQLGGRLRVLRAPSEASSSHLSRHGSPVADRQTWDAALSPELGTQHSEYHTDKEVTLSTFSPIRAVRHPRLRHDDSQVHFEPIESSPLPEEEPESQFLTTRQKEVRDRQRTEPAVVFPDLKSSPTARARSVSQMDCEFARKVASQVERPSTPTLPANQDQGEQEVTASPTPRARHIALQITDMEVPSSPPSMVGNNDRQEITSSPPQAVPEDAREGITLAIVQTEEAACQDAMEVDGVAVLEAGRIQSAAVVENHETEPETDIVMNEQVSATHVNGQQISVAESLPPTIHGNDNAEDFIITSQSAAPFKTRATRNRFSQRLNRERVPAASRRSSSLRQASHEDTTVSSEASDREDFQQQEDQDEDSDADQILPPPEAASLTPLRPITINMTSDSTNSDGHDGDRDKSPVLQPTTDSDEIDMLSASQLSQDLDQYVNEIVETETDEYRQETNVEARSGPHDGDGDPRYNKRKSRKRKSNQQKFTVAKRRKSAASARSSVSNEASSSVNDTDGDLLDCIEVSPSQAVEAAAAVDLDQQEASTVSRTELHPKRRRGRPRKRHSTETSQSSENSRVEVVVRDVSDVKDEVEEIDGVSATLPEHGNSERRHQSQGPDVDVEETTAILEISEGREGGVHEGFMSSLETALNRLKSATAGEIDLRAVEDLCFQIRFQAQVLAQQGQRAGRT